MTDLQIIQLGRDGIAYVEECLRQGTGLCTKALRLPLIEGKAFAPVPEGTSLERAKLFSVGGLMTRRSAHAWFARHVQALWQPGKEGTLVLQDIWAKPSDSVAQDANLKRFFHNENVYYCFGRSDVDIYSLQSGIRAMASYLFIGFFSRLSLHCDAGHVVQDGLIAEIADATEEIFVGAYDQEGLVVWHR